MVVGRSVSVILRIIDFLTSRGSEYCWSQRRIYQRCRAPPIPANLVVGRQRWISPRQILTLTVTRHSSDERFDSPRPACDPLTAVVHPYAPPSLPPGRSGKRCCAPAGLTAARLACE